MLHCCFFYHHLLYLCLFLCPYLHNVYVLTNAALSHHESGCCSGCAKSEGQQRKAICLLHLRAKTFFCLKKKKNNTKKVTGQVDEKKKALYITQGVVTAHNLQQLFNALFHRRQPSGVAYVYISAHRELLPVCATSNPPVTPRS